MWFSTALSFGMLTVCFIFIFTSLTTSALLGIAGVGLYYAFFHRNGHLPLPPGPRCWPIVGHLLSLGNQPYQTFQEMGKIYGGFFTLFFGSQAVIVINDAKLIAETFSKVEFCGRPLSKNDLSRMSGQRRGIIFAKGQNWLNKRRFVLHHLKSFGFGKMSMENMINNEIDEVIAIFKTNVNQTMEIELIFYRSLVNAVWQIVAGSRFPHDDKRFAALQSNSQSRVKRAQMIGMMKFSPWILKIWEIFNGTSSSSTSISGTDPMIDYMKEVIKDHKTTFVNGQPRDLIDIFLEENSKLTNPEEITEAEFDLPIVIFDLFVSSPFAVNFALTWITILLALNPTIQKNVQHEIQRIVGGNNAERRISLSHKHQMPYSMAVIKEVIRYTQKSSLNGATFHSTICDTELAGYLIPKDTIIIPNLYASMQDKNVFKSPDRFDPNRFLSSEDGESKLTKVDEWIPFSVGKRDCIGRSLAMDELFLYMTNIFNRFNVENVNDFIMLEYANITLTNPASIEIVFRDRNECDNLTV